MGSPEPLALPNLAIEMKSLLVTVTHPDGPFHHGSRSVQDEEYAPNWSLHPDSLLCVDKARECVACCCASPNIRDVPADDAPMKQEAILSVATTFDLDPDDVIPTSAKTGEGVDQASVRKRKGRGKIWFV